MLRLHPRQLPSRRRVSLLAQPPARRRDSAEAEDRGRVLRLHQGHMQQRVRLTRLPPTPARSPEGSRGRIEASQPDATGGGSRKARRTLFDDRHLTLFLDATLKNVLPSSADHHRPPVDANHMTRPTPQGRVPFLARRAGGRGVRETRGGRPAASEGAAEAASGSGGEAGGFARRAPADGRAL